jgi:hypothetical protein
MNLVRKAMRMARERRRSPEAAARADSRQVLISLTVEAEEVRTT